MKKILFLILISVMPIAHSVQAQTGDPWSELLDYTAALTGYNTFMMLNSIELLYHSEGATEEEMLRELDLQMAYLSELEEKIEDVIEFVRKDPDGTGKTEGLEEYLFIVKKLKAMATSLKDVISLPSDENVDFYIKDKEGARKYLSVFLK